MTPLRRHAPVLALLGAALVAASTGGAVAGSLITGAQIKDGTVTSADVKDHTLKPKDLSRKATAALTGATGPAGPAGPAGPSAADFADSSLPPNSPLNSSGDSVAATSVASQTITLTTASRIVVTGVATLESASGDEYAGVCGVRIRPAGGADSSETAIGATESVLGSPTGTGSTPTATVTALGMAIRPAGSYTVHLRCSDSLSQAALVHDASIAAVATADAG